MLLISHRGNIDGSNPDKENHPTYLQNAINCGYHAEVDVWYIDGKYILGHDKPQYEISSEFLLNDKLWHHTKNIQALFHLNRMRPNYLINCFFHNTDEAILTSGGWIWTYPGGILTEDSIAVMPEIVDTWKIDNCYGVCTDQCKYYSTLFNK